MPAPKTMGRQAREVESRDLGSRLYTVPDVEDLTGFNVRHLIFHDKDRFATECVVRCGRAVRIRADRLAAWIERHTTAKPYKYSEEWRRKNLLAPTKRPKKKRKKRQPARVGR